MMQTIINSKKLRRGIAIAHWIFAAFPILLIISLAGMTYHASRLIGKFPVCMWDEPYQFGQYDRYSIKTEQAFSLNPKLQSLIFTNN